MEDSVYGDYVARPSQASYDWSEILSKFPVVEDKFHEKLRRHYAPEFNDTRYSDKYHIYYCDFEVEIKPTLFSDFRGVDFTILFMSVIDDCIARAIRTFADPSKRPFDRVKGVFHSAEIEPLQMDFVNLDQLSSQMIMSFMYGVLQSKRDLVTSSDCNVALTFI